jgi:hypothetical protein
MAPAELLAILLNHSELRIAAHELLVLIAKAIFVGRPRTFPTSWVAFAASPIAGLKEVGKAAAPAKLVRLWPPFVVLLHSTWTHLAVVVVWALAFHTVRMAVLPGIVFVQKLLLLAFIDIFAGLLLERVELGRACVSIAEALFSSGRPVYGCLSKSSVASRTGVWAHAAVH